MGIAGSFWELWCVTRACIRSGILVIRIDVESLCTATRQDSTVGVCRHRGHVMALLAPEDPRTLDAALFSLVSLFYTQRWMGHTLPRPHRGRGPVCSQGCSKLKSREGRKHAQAFRSWCNRFASAVRRYRKKKVQGPAEALQCKYNTLPAVDRPLGHGAVRVSANSVGIHIHKLSVNNAESEFQLA